MTRCLYSQNSAKTAMDRMPDTGNRSRKYRQLYWWKSVPVVDPALTLIYTPHGLKLGSYAQLECWKFRRYR